VKHIALLLLVACGGEAASPVDVAPFGWCCDGYCGLSANESDYFEQCTCDGAERPGDGSGRGECVEPLTD
jgi:hypothetical protein